MTAHTHETISTAIRQRITNGEWSPGATIPREQDLSDEYGCSRATVNRALQKLAEDGLVVRKRRAGTRVADLPVHQAKFKIPIVRIEVESSGAVYRPQVILRSTVKAPLSVRNQLSLKTSDRVLHIQTVHMANARPFVFEDRWVNLSAAPEILNAPLDRISANEWLVRKIPYSNGDVVFGASEATRPVAEALETREGASLFTVRRRTWLDDEYITTVTLHFQPGYEMTTRY